MDNTVKKLVQFNKSYDLPPGFEDLFKGFRK